MRVSELVAASGVPLATVKYYLREGVLMPGEATSATQSVYGDEHLRRLALIKALAGVGLPIGRIRSVLQLVDRPEHSIVETLGRAVSELPPYLDAPDSDGDDYSRAKAAIESLGQVYDPRFTAVAQLERALRAAADVGIPMTDERLEVYGRSVRAIAEYDLAMMPEPADEAIEYAVLGTAMYEPIIAALRRLAHQHIASSMQTNAEHPERPTR